MASIAELLAAQQAQADAVRRMTGELPGLNQAKAQAAQLQNQPMAATEMLRPADQTPFGEMRKLSPQELAARGTATVPSQGFQNPNLRGANFNRVVPYNAAKQMQEQGWDISPEMIREYQKAGINKLAAERGGNYEVTVGHEGSHDQIWNELANRKFTQERYAGKPEGNLAMADYVLERDKNLRSDDPYFQNLNRAAYNKFGNPKYASVQRALKAYEATAPIPAKFLENNKKAK